MSLRFMGILVLMLQSYEERLKKPAFYTIKSFGKAFFG